MKQIKVLFTFKRDVITLPGCENCSLFGHAIFNYSLPFFPKIVNMLTPPSTVYCYYLWKYLLALYPNIIHIPPLTK